MCEQFAYLLPFLFLLPPAAPQANVCRSARFLATLGAADSGSDTVELITPVFLPLPRVAKARAALRRALSVLCGVAPVDARSRAIALLLISHPSRLHVTAVRRARMCVPATGMGWWLY
jgi:hypothetical protein